LRAADTARLVALAAIWGASYLFNRIVAPTLGPVLTAELRTLIGGIALAVYFLFTGYNPELRRYWRQYVLAAILSSALPFVLWAYAALSVTAGLLIGLAGVAVVTRPDSNMTLHYPSIAAALAAAFSYGLIATYIKGWAKDVPSRGWAVGTQLAAGVLLVPFIPLSPPVSAPAPRPRPSDA
jgi:drug/metabolite transporter (DMT)-like permease